MKSTKLISLLTVLLLIVGIQELIAYTWPKCANVSRRKQAFGVVSLHANTASFPAGTAQRTALAGVSSRFNTIPSTVFYTTAFDDIFSARSNGVNEVWFANIDPPGVCYLTMNSSCQITESDVIFDTSVNYNYGTSKVNLTPYGGAARPFRTTAMHEYGHAQGLGHTADRYSIMGQDWDHIHANGGVATAYPGEDAIAGSVDTYGLESTTFEDVGVAHWRRTGASGEYSIHNRTRLLNSFGSELTLLAGTIEPTYRVVNGQTVKLEMTYENMGRTTRTVKVGFYLSTDHTISIADKFLGSGTITIARNAPDTTSNALVVIPTNLTRFKNYWLGVIVDYDNALTEKFESNNATYVQIWVQ
jgi:hypothetical protein